MNPVHIKIYHSEIQNVIKALDLYSRIGCGQFYEFFTDRTNVPRPPSADCENFKTLLFSLFDIDLPGNAYIGIQGANLNYKMAYLIRCCIGNIFYNSNSEIASYNVWKNTPLIDDEIAKFGIPAVYLKPTGLFEKICDRCKKGREIFDLDVWFPDPRQELLFANIISLRTMLNFELKIDRYIATLVMAYAKPEHLENINNNRQLIQDYITLINAYLSSSTR